MTVVLVKQYVIPNVLATRVLYLTRTLCTCIIYTHTHKSLSGFACFLEITSVQTGTSTPKSLPPTPRNKLNTSAVQRRAVRGELDDVNTIRVKKSQLLRRPYAHTPYSGCTHSIHALHARRLTNDVRQSFAAVFDAQRYSNIYLPKKQFLNIFRGHLKLKP